MLCGVCVVRFAVCCGSGGGCGMVLWGLLCCYFLVSFGGSVCISVTIYSKYSIFHFTLAKSIGSSLHYYCMRYIINII